MMGADLLTRFRQAGLEATGQQRNVTILFVDLAGFTAFSRRTGNEDTYILIQQFTNLMVQDVYKYDGMVDKFLGDGLMAIFGAPIAHENNTELAVRAALDMRADVNRLAAEMQARLDTSLNLHIGLHSGPILIENIGSNLLLNYTPLGDTLDLAYRLLEAATPGCILASQSVKQQALALVDFDPLPPLTLKGVEAPVPAFTVRQLKALPGPSHSVDGLRASLVGRNADLKLLGAARDALATRKEGRFILIRGEAGIGKSRLVQEFSATLEPAGLRCLTGHSLIYHRSMSFWIFQDLLFAFLNLLPGVPEEGLRARLSEVCQDLLGAQAAVAIPYLEYLFSLPPLNETVANRLSLLDAAQLRQQVFVSVRDLLVAEACRMPLALIFENLHWADEASLELLRFLVDSVQSEPLLIVGLSRPSDEPGFCRLIECADRTLAERFTLIVLGNLSATQSERLFDGLLTAPDMPADFRQRILERASGNPFFLEEMVRMLIDAGLVHRENADGWRPIPGVNLSSLELPESLRGLILARFDRLAEFQRRVLQVASVIGRDFSSQVVARVLQLSEWEELESALTELVDRGFLRPLLPGGDADYRFSHTLVSDTIYSLLLKIELVDLHGRVGEALEQLYASRLDNRVELLARHYAISNRPDKALHFLILAGNKSARGFANVQARKDYEQALGVLKQVEPSLEQVLQVYTGLGDVLIRLGEYPPARDTYFTAMDALDGRQGRNRREDAPIRASLHRKVATTCEHQGDYAQALSELSAARAALEEMPEPSPVDRGWVLNDAGWIHFRRGDLDGAGVVLLEALHLVEDGRNYDLIASIYNRLGGVCYQKDQLDQASSYVRKSLFLRQEIGDTNGVARSYNNLGLLRWKRGDWDSALDDFSRSLKLHANLGDVEGAIELHSNLGLLHLDRGNFEEARRHLETGLASARQIGHSYHIGLIYLHFCRLYVSLENWETALKYCRLGLQTFNEIGVMENLVDLNTYAGLAYLGLGDVNMAEKCACDALELYNRLNVNDRTGMSEDRGRALRLLAQVCLARKLPEKAAGYLKESASIFKHVGNQVEQGRTSLVQAQQAMQMGASATARILLNEARLIFRQLGARIDLKKVEAISVR